MANRVILSEIIISSDRFCLMSAESQALYVHLCLSADKHGFINNVHSIIKGLSFDIVSIDELCSCGFVERKSKYEYFINDWSVHAISDVSAESRNTYAYRNWRKSIIDRDKKCVKCGSTENLVAHHIKSYKVHEELRLDVNNGITLCMCCHRKEHKKRSKK